MQTNASIRIAVASFVLVAGLLPISAPAKEVYLEQVRTALMLRASRCSTCHVDNDPVLWTDDGLNYYGQRLKSIEGGSSEPLSNRMILLDRPPQDSDDPNATVALPPVGDDGVQLGPNSDADGDGIENWVEILAEANPGDPDDKPSENRIKRVRYVMSCKICHTGNNLPGKIGREANPHNEFGELLAVTDDPTDRKKRVSPADRRSAAERVQILRRIAVNSHVKPEGERATYWERLRLMYLPVDPDRPTNKKRLMNLRKHVIAQKSERRRDPTLGVPKEGHEIGFVRAAEGLD